MEIYSALSKDIVRERLRELLETHSTSTPRGALTGSVATHQMTIRTRPMRLSLPWRGTFRGVMIPRGSGTAITGKFDSKWSLYFVGYPIVVGVVINIAVTIVAGQGAGHLGTFALFIAAAVLICVYLNWINVRDNRSIIEAICHAIDGRIERETG